MVSKPAAAQIQSLPSVTADVLWRFYFWSVPGLKFFGAQGVGDVLDGVTQTVGVVVRGVDTPAERRVEDSEQTRGGGCI